MLNKGFSLYIFIVDIIQSLKDILRNTFTRCVIQVIVSLSGHV